MLEVGQLRRWTWKSSPLVELWDDKVFLLVEEIPRWIDKNGKRYSMWSFMIDGQVETGWTGDDIEKMSEAINEDSP